MALMNKVLHINHQQNYTVCSF